MFPNYETIAHFEQGRMSRPVLFKQVEADLTKAFIVEASLAHRLRFSSSTEAFMAKIVVARMIANTLTSLIAVRIHPVEFVGDANVSFEVISKLLFFVTNDRKAMNLAFRDYFVEHPSHMSNHKDWMAPYRYVLDTWSNWLDRFTVLPEKEPNVLLSRIPKTKLKFSWFRLWLQFRYWFYNRMDIMGRLFGLISNGDKIRRL